MTPLCKSANPSKRKRRISNADGGGRRREVTPDAEQASVKSAPSDGEAPVVMAQSVPLFQHFNAASVGTASITGTSSSGYEAGHFSNWRALEIRFPALLSHQIMPARDRS